MTAPTQPIHLVSVFLKRMRFIHCYDWKNILKNDLNYYIY